MRVACAPNAQTTRLEVPAPNGHAVRVDEFMGKITLADDSLRSQWNGVSPVASSLDLPESILS
jgi:hypothetical protein